MVSLDVDWDCGLRLCLNTVRAEETSELSLGEFGVWIRLGARVAWTPEGEAWPQDSGLLLGDPQQG